MLAGYGLKPIYLGVGRRVASVQVRLGLLEAWTVEAQDAVLAISGLRGLGFRG